MKKDMKKNLMKRIVAIITAAVMLFRWQHSPPAQKSRMIRKYALPH